MTGVCGGMGSARTVFDRDSMCVREQVYAFQSFRNRQLVSWYVLNMYKK